MPNRDHARSANGGGSCRPAAATPSFGMSIFGLTQAASKTCPSGSSNSRLYRKAPSIGERTSALPPESAAAFTSASTSARLSRVRHVETSHEPLARIAEATGFRDAGSMRRAFMRGFGQPPLELRRARARFARAPRQAG